MFNGQSVLALAFDFETTGLAVETLGVCQSALCITTIHQDGSYEIHEKDVQLLDPIVEIEPTAAGIHGYDNFACIGKPKWTEYLPEQFGIVHDHYNVAALVGYNNKTFDNRIGFRVGLRPLPSLDLMVAVRKLKKPQNWEKGTLVYAYQQLMGRNFEKAHDAFADVQATLDIIQPAMRLVGVETLDEFAAWMKGDDGTPDMIIPFGKDKGLKLKRLERSYVKWLLGPECKMVYSAELRQGLEACLV